jgi:putative endopeptidase
LGHPQLKQINLAAPEYFKRLNVLLKSIPLTDWKTYLRWRLVHNTGAYLSQPYFDESFRFYAQLTGAKQPLPKWKRVITSENSDLAFALGQLYVQQVFGQASKQEVMQMVRNIQATLDSDLQHLSWMTPKTRKAAQLKLKSMTFRLGYPDKWMDYSKLEINAGPWVLNHLRASQFLMEFELNKIGKPVDKSEWVMPPQTVNAYYDPAQNTMNFPAGILQPPFFDPQAPASVNYGAIGVIIGHEMTHGFDDQGAKFDEKGNLNTWWSAEDEQRFDEKVACISDQFSKYKVQGLAVVGQLVAGEALADLGGTVLAYRALHRSMGGKTAPFIQGLSPDQQFFLSSAHVWAANIRPEAEVSHVLSDPHPPLVFRINGTFSNLSEFAQAYGVRAPSAMINPRRCDLW